MKRCAAAILLVLALSAATAFAQDVEAAAAAKLNCKANPAKCTAKIAALNKALAAKVKVAANQAKTINALKRKVSAGTKAVTEVSQVTNLAKNTLGQWGVGTAGLSDASDLVNRVIANVESSPACQKNTDLLNNLLGGLNLCNNKASGGLLGGVTGLLGCVTDLLGGLGLGGLTGGLGGGLGGGLLG